MVDNKTIRVGMARFGVLALAIYAAWNGFHRLLCSLVLGPMSFIAWRKIRFNRVTTSGRVARPLLLRGTSAFDVEELESKVEGKKALLMSIPPTSKRAKLLRDEMEDGENILAEIKTLEQKLQLALQAEGFKQPAEFLELYHKNLQYVSDDTHRRHARAVEAVASEEWKQIVELLVNLGLMLESDASDSSAATTMTRGITEASTLDVASKTTIPLSQVMLLLCKMSTSGSSFVFLGVWHSTS